MWRCVSETLYPFEPHTTTLSSASAHTYCSANVRRNTSIKVAPIGVVVVAVCWDEWQVQQLYL